MIAAWKIAYLRIAGLQISNKYAESRTLNVIKILEEMLL